MTRRRFRAAPSTSIERKYRPLGRAAPLATRPGQTQSAMPEAATLSRHRATSRPLTSKIFPHPLLPGLPRSVNRTDPWLGVGPYRRSSAAGVTVPPGPGGEEGARTERLVTGFWALGSPFEFHASHSTV